VKLINTDGMAFVARCRQIDPTAACRCTGQRRSSLATKCSAASGQTVRSTDLATAA
jgi:hypothetical protein